MLVHNWMTHTVVTISPEESLLTAQKVMEERGIRRLPVVERGKLIGIITHTDILRAIPLEASEDLWEFDCLHPLAKRTVAEVMTPEPLTVSPETTLEEAALLMQEHKISGLPVVDEGELVGIITESDIFTAMTEILGFRWGGVRLEIEVEDRPEALLQVLEALRRHAIGIISLASCRATCASAPGRTRVAVIRFEGGPAAATATATTTATAAAVAAAAAVEGLLEELRAQGVTIRDIRYHDQSPSPIQDRG